MLVKQNLKIRVVWMSLSRMKMPCAGSGSTAPLIHLLISALVCLFTPYASHLSYFLHFFPYLSFSLRIDLLRFQAGGCKR